MDSVNWIYNALSFISGCTAFYTIQLILNKYRLSNAEKYKCRMINCLLDRLLLDSKIRELDSKILKNKERKIDKVNKLKQANIQKCIRWCMEYNIPYNNDMPKVNIFLNRATN